MAEIRLLGLFENAEQIAQAVESLRSLGVTDDQMTVMSSSPYQGTMLSRPKHRTRLGLIALLGAIMGVALAAFLTAGLFLLYPLRQGGQPLVPIPPSLIVFFEVTMLGTMYATFFGMLILNRLPAWGRHGYDPRVTLGNISLQALVQETLAERVVEVMNQAGAADVIRETVTSPRPDRTFRNFWMAFSAGLAITAIILGLFVYDILRIPFPTNMWDQDVVAYDQGPRLAAPADAVPIQGPVLINGQPASEPLPATPASIERGKTYFGIVCQVCHGATGAGNGPISGFLNPKPADLTSARVQSLSDQQLFLVITEGVGIMPSYYENLTVEDRWHVINYVRTLKK